MSPLVNCFFEIFTNKKILARPILYIANILDFLMVGKQNT